MVTVKKQVMAWVQKQTWLGRFEAQGSAGEEKEVTWSALCGKAGGMGRTLLPHVLPPFLREASQGKTCLLPPAGVLQECLSVGPSWVRTPAGRGGLRVPAQPPHARPAALCGSTWPAATTWPPGGAGLVPPETAARLHALRSWYCCRLQPLARCPPITQLPHSTWQWFMVFPPWCNTAGNLKIDVIPQSIWFQLGVFSCA